MESVTIKIPEKQYPYLATWVGTERILTRNIWIN